MKMKNLKQVLKEKFKSKQIEQLIVAEIIDIDFIFKQYKIFVDETLQLAVGS